MDCCVKVVSGTGQWGPNPAWLESKQPGDLIYHAPAQPHCIQGNHHIPLQITCRTIPAPAEEPLLALYACSGQLGGRYWFCEELEEELNSSIAVVNTPELHCAPHCAGQVADPRSYYDQLAGDYERVVRGWGYNCPELVADIVLDWLDKAPSWDTLGWWRQYKQSQVTIMFWVCRVRAVRAAGSGSGLR